MFGSIGAFGGGYLSDKLAAKYGMKGRMIVLVACLVRRSYADVISMG